MEVVCLILGPTLTPNLVRILFIFLQQFRINYHTYNYEDSTIGLMCTTVYLSTCCQNYVHVVCETACNEYLANPSAVSCNRQLNPCHSGYNSVADFDLH